MSELTPKYRKYMELLLSSGSPEVDSYTRTDDIVPQPAPEITRFKVDRSAIHGRGVFPKVWLLPGEYAGLIYNVDLQRTSLLGRWLNHSETPNLVPVLTSRGVVAFAKDEIPKRTEATICYLELTRLALKLDTPAASLPPAAALASALVPKGQK